MKSLFVFSRRSLLKGALSAGALLAVPSFVHAADVPVIRYASAGVVGPGELETVIFSDWFKQNVLTRHGKDYVIETTTARGTPGVATLLAAGQADLGTLAFTSFATVLAQQAVPGGVTAIAEIHKDGVKGYASNPFVVLEDSPIKTIADLKGKRVAVNAFNGSVDIILRIALEQQGLDPRKDVRVVEMPFGNIGTALRQKRIEAGVLAMPFQVDEMKKGGMRVVFDAVGVVPPYPILFQAARTEFLQEHPDAVRAWLADYVDAVKWIYAPENREKLIEVTADLAKTPAESLNEYFLTEKDFYRDADSCISASGLQAPVDAMAKLGLLPEAVDVAPFVDSSYLPGPCSK
ncbi:MAG TPA: ABC transporter substrate-binding protein [Pusillimonas sp.]|uniref:ABC transporter substrate-binding protein n=1 Tax=Pusillimonas sp. TaxID=3040095 RepID=UPI002CC578BB|nr:ABC transporter substrate-binding protein [Pusillimonas sp.]HUH87940.1 ABC transporter substrate-binding protein [Pusillimonas sp.]